MKKIVFIVLMVLSCLTANAYTKHVEGVFGDGSRNPEDYKVRIVVVPIDEEFIEKSWGSFSTYLFAEFDDNSDRVYIPYENIYGPRKIFDHTFKNSIESAEYYNEIIEKSKEKSNTKNVIIFYFVLNKEGKCFYKGSETTIGCISLTDRELFYSGTHLRFEINMSVKQYGDKNNTFKETDLKKYNAWDIIYSDKYGNLYTWDFIGEGEYEYKEYKESDWEFVRLSKMSDYEEFSLDDIKTK